MPLSERTMKWVFLLVLTAVLIFPASQAVSAEEPPRKKITFIPHWLPQAQFAGFYVAQEKGFYRKRGLDVVILRGGPEKPPVQLLKNGKADVATLWLTSALQAQTPQFRLLNAAQLIQRSALMLVARKDSGITKVQDLQGKRVSLWEGDLSIQPLAFFRKHYLQVTVVPQSSTPNLFLRGGVDAASAMWYNEYHTILNAGVNPEELTTFLFADYGLNFPEDGIYVPEKAFRKDPHSFCAFVEASLEGWRYAFAHQDEAVDIVMQRQRQEKLPANRVHQLWMLKRLKDVYGSDHAPIGILREEDYLTVAGTMQANGLISGYPNFERFAAGCDSHGR